MPLDTMFCTREGPVALPSVLHADDHLVIVDKPAGLVVHPTYKNTDGTLLDMLRQQLPDPPSIVGRLDRWTSGIVVVARNSRAHAALQQAMAAPDCHKDYLAIVHGHVPDRLDIDLRLRIDERDRRRVVASPNRGAPSLTHIARLEIATTGDCRVSLVRCRLSTGRRHQIRAHLSALGWPVVADLVYGDSSRENALAAVIGQVLPRQALHASHLRMTHPVSGARLDVTAPLPGDLDRMIQLFDGWTGSGSRWSATALAERRCWSATALAERPAS